MSSNEPPVRQPKAVLCDLKGLAAMLAVNTPAVVRDLDAGGLPAPVIVGGETRWRIAEVRDWTAAGCPGRDVWAWRTAKDKPLPANRKPARQAPAPAPPAKRYDNFKVPTPGKAVFAWAAEMQKVFETNLIDGMARDGEEQGWGRQFANWSGPQVNTIASRSSPTSASFRRTAVNLNNSSPVIQPAALLGKSPV